MQTCKGWWRERYGSYVYFVADGVLAEGANSEGATPIEGEPNLYSGHAGATTFIATLAPEDGESAHRPAASGDWQADPGHRTAEVTPDGQSVVFMSTLRLTGYDNVIEVGHKSIELTEVFLYDEQSGRLVCVSCNPSGERPISEIYPGIRGIHRTQRTWHMGWIFAS